MSGLRTVGWATRGRIFVLLGVLVLGLTVFGEGFWGLRNLQNLATSVAIDGIMVVGMTIVMVGRGFDLSVGSVMALAGVAVMDAMPLSLPVAVAVALAAAAMAGAFNGVLIAYLRVNPFIATFGTMVMIRGLVMAYTNARPIAGENLDFMLFGRALYFGIPASAVVFALALVAGHVFLRYTRSGRHVYAIGGNEDASWLAGVPVRRVKLATYVLSGLAAGIAGILLAARLNTGSPIIGETTPLFVIAAVLLGGVTLAGGVGAMAGSLAGLLCLGVLINGFNLIELPAYYQRLVQGLLLVLLVIYDWWMRRRE